MATSKIIRDNAKVGIVVGDFYIDYKGDTEIKVDNLEPISDNKIDANTKDNVIRMDFSLKGLKLNSEDNIIYDVIMSDMNIDCSLLNEYTKWNLYKNGSLISSGNMSPKFDGDVYNKTMKLTTIQETLPKYNEDYDNYTFIMWISESCEDINTCAYVDQSNIINKNFSYKVFVALFTGTKTENIRKSNYDTSCANTPDLYNNMVPVYYKNDNVVKADSSNSDGSNLWYDYTNKKWANAVIVKKDNYYIGETIPVEDILAYYVWIPRYKYKVWNINMEYNHQEYDAYNNGIDIIFENGLNTSGEITCTNGKCTGNNLEYYTHPAFGNDLRGIWVSKYEMSIGQETNFIPNEKVYTNSDVTEFEDIISNINNQYKIEKDIESAIINNYEWGSIAYLTHSKYGNMNLIGNNSYVSGKSNNDSTTGNIYGIYDMSGGASEFVNINKGLGTATTEILQEENLTWDNNYYYDGSFNGYYIRGGLNRGMYSCSSFDESSPLISVRNVLKQKELS